jgi:hypothetical protein
MKEAFIFYTKQILGAQFNILLIKFESFFHIMLIIITAL